MSHGEDTNDKPKPPTERAADKPQQWDRIQDDIKSALDSWSDLTVKKARQPQKKNPDEQQLHEIKQLLGDLKNKIRDFDKE